MRARHIRKIFLTWALVMSLMLISRSYGMIRTLPVEKLISDSEYIVIAQVYSVTVAGTEPSTKLITLRNEMKLIESLKGVWPAREPIVLNTRRHEDHWIEDNVELPPPGTKVVLFLTRYQGRLVPVNGIQGVWPLQGNKLLQMGTGKTLDDIRKIVRNQELFK